MKIIQPGKDIKAMSIKRFICEKCGCVFEADSTEYKFTDIWGQMHDGLPVYNCKCPNCGTDVYAN